ncbi:hypothetical protein BH11CYA1_BH11CYA1_23030 [soil metagenome]
MCGSGEQFQLRVLTVLIPLWLLILPTILFVAHDSLWSIGIIITFFACAMSFGFLLKNQLTFRQDELKFPGFWGPTLKYAEIKRVYLHSASQLCIEATTEIGEFKKKVEISGLSRESAASLWAIMATRMRSAEISANVRERFKNWIGAKANQALALPASAEMAITAKDNQASRELQILVDIKSHSRLKQMLSYMGVYEATGYRTWTIFWFGIAALFLFGCLVRWLAVMKLLPQGSGTILNNVVEPIVTGLFFWWEPLVWLTQVVFANVFGACGYVALILITCYYSIKSWSEPDSAFIDHLGITAQLKTPTGNVPQEHLSWQSIASVKLLNDKRKAKSSAVVQFNSRSDRLPIEIPLRAFAGENRENFLEALNSWGMKVTIDPKLLEALTVQAESSYTELWLSSLEAAPQLSQLTPLNAKDKLAHHGLEIEKLLASGGQGVTYIARWGEQPNSPRVVLKEIIIPIYIEKARQRVAQRFERDAKLLKSLDHPKIVKLHDYFIEEHRAFLMLEYIEGTTLQEKVELNDALTEQEVLTLAEQMIEILDYLHSRTPPVVHRDFTPDNLMVSENGEVKLIDFDVALEADEAVKSKATIVGKQNFLPPEQFRGHPCPQSDIYAFGATLYYLLTAREPDALESCHPQYLTDNVSDRLDSFIARCTEPELKRRFRNIEDLRADLTEILVSFRN